MRVSVWSCEAYPVYEVNATHNDPKDPNGVEIDKETYIRWKKAYMDFNKVQEEIIAKEKELGRRPHDYPWDGFFHNEHYIYDSINKLYWQKNIHYGFNFQNQSIFEARFTPNINEATPLSCQKAQDILYSFKNKEYVLGGIYKTKEIKLELVQE